MIRGAENELYLAGLVGQRCPGCDCLLEPYEVFACRIRGLKKPVCLGCLATTVKWLKDSLLPVVEGMILRALDS